MKKINTVWIIILLQLHQVIFGTDFNSELREALVYERLKLAEKIIDEGSIEIEYEDDHGDTFLHLLSDISPYTEEIPIYLSIAEKLIRKGCSVNKFNNISKPCLATVYDYIDAFSTTVELIENGQFDKWDDNDGEYFSILNVALSTLLIKNGALLMVDEDDEKWNILDKIIYNLKNEGHCRSRSMKLRLDRCLIQDALYKTFMCGYDQYKKSYLTTALIFKCFQKNKKTNLSNKLIKHIMSFYIDPTEHIEATIKDSWKSRCLEKPFSSNLITKNFNAEVNEYLLTIPTSNYYEKLLLNAEKSRLIRDDIAPLITAGVWSRDWKNYQSGERSENNLVVKALTYVKDEQHAWNR